MYSSGLVFASGALLIAGPTLLCHGVVATGTGTGTGETTVAINQEHDHRKLQKYTSNEITIIASIVNLDENGSNQKCIQLTQNAPDSIEYTKACFTALYGAQSEFVNCAVTINDATQCDSCTTCTTADGQPGFELDCFFFHQYTSTNDECVALNDENVQRVLTSDLFEDQKIDFADAPTSASSISCRFLTAAALASAFILWMA